MALCGCLIAALLARAPLAVASGTTQRLDALLSEAAQASQLTLSPQADDATFVRRVWLDLAGRTPPVEAARRFAGSQPVEKPRELIAGGGPSDSSGPANFLLSYNVQPAPLAGAVSKKFLGLTMHCAECHD